MRVLLQSAAFISITSLVAIHSSRAQGASTVTPAGTGVTQGRVVNAASRAPITAATVDVATIGGTAPTARVATNADGTFRLQGLHAGRYRAQIRALGYKPWDIPAITIGASSPTADLGTIALTAAPLELRHWRSPASGRTFSSHRIATPTSSATCRPPRVATCWTFCATFHPWTWTSTTS